jgi:tetratricopeptide (TPR) repeat protein
MTYLRGVLFVALLVLSSSSHAADLWKDCQSEDLDLALRGCTQIIESRNMPLLKRGQAHSMRAFAHQRTNQLGKAVADFSEAIRLMKVAGKADFELAFTYYVRGIAYRASGNLDRAIEDETESIRVAPGWDKAYSERGAIHFQKGDLERALADISKVISFRPDSPRVADSYAIRAMVHLRMGQPAQGLPDADRAIELTPRSSLGHYVRAKACEALGRDEEAVAARRTALEINPKIVEQMEEIEQWGKK